MTEKTETRLWLATLDGEPNILFYGPLATTLYLNLLRGNAEPEWALTDRVEAVVVPEKPTKEEVERVQAAIRRTREYRAGVAFTVPEDARPSHSEALARAAIAAMRQS